MSGRWTGRVRASLLALAGLGVGGEELDGQCSGGATPSAPALVTGVPVTESAIFLTWLPVSDAQGGVRHYVVYRDGVATTTRTTTFFVDNGLQASTRYRYRVSAVDAQGCEGAQSSQVNVRTLPGPTGGDATPPSTPAGLTPTDVSASHIALSWQASEDAQSGIASYRLYRDGAPVATMTGTSFTDPSVLPFTTYTYEVTAMNGDGLQSQRSEPVSVRTLDPTPPTVPAGLQASVVSASQIDLAWQASTDPESGIASYRIYRDGQHVGTASGPSFSDTSVQPATTYGYEVSAVNGDGLEGARSAVTATTPSAPDTSEPSAPTGLEADVRGARQVVLTWRAAADPESGISAYRLYRDGARVASVTGTSYTDSEVDPETTYAYRVSAVNGAGLEGPPSPSVSAATPTEVDATPPAPPTRMRIVP